MKRRNLFTLTIAMVCAGAFTAHLPAKAQDFPSKPISMVVPFAAGGLTDTVARTIGQSVASKLGQPVIISNNPGGGGQIAAGKVLQAPADGHTIFVGATDMFAINPTLYKNFSFDPLKDFAPVAPLVKSPLILVVPSDSPIGSVDELISQSRKRGLNFASQGMGSLGQLLGEQLRQHTKDGKFSHVAYRGSAPALQDLIGRQVDFMFDPIISTEPFIKSGKLKPLAIAAEKRAPQLPDLPTLTELGVPGVDSGVWFGAVVRKGTPQEAIDKLNQAIHASLEDPEIIKSFQQQGLQGFTLTPAAFGEFMQAEAIRWAPLVKASGASVD